MFSILYLVKGDATNKLQKKGETMQEKEKIVKLIEEHKALFEITDMDVAESMKGQWLFSRYNSEHDYYDSLVHFKTAKELAEIILGELAIDIFVTIDCEPEGQPELYNFANDVEMKACYQPHIERLIKYLG